MRQPTNAELDELAARIESVRRNWARIPNIRRCDFVGGVDDLDALGYVGYEGLTSYFKHEAQTGYPTFALVLGNVLVRQLGFEWVVSDGVEGGRFHLRHERLPRTIDPARDVWDASCQAGWRYPDFRALYDRIRSSVATATPGR